MKRLNFKWLNFLFTLLLILPMLPFKTCVFAQDSAGTKIQVQTETQIRSDCQQGYTFVDENGDGYNDNAPDIDGDGIPNGLDSDYIGPDKVQAGNKDKGFVDIDADGISDDITLRHGPKPGKNAKGSLGPGNKAGKRGIRTQDGIGPGVSNGNCTGTGVNANPSGRQGGLNRFERRREPVCPLPHL
jgi:hypothetical protein